MQYEEPCDEDAKSVAVASPYLFQRAAPQKEIEQGEGEVDEGFAVVGVDEGAEGLLGILARPEPQNLRWFIGVLGERHEGDRQTEEADTEGEDPERPGILRHLLEQQQETSCGQDCDEAPRRGHGRE